MNIQKVKLQYVSTEKHLLFKLTWIMENRRFMITFNKMAITKTCICLQSTCKSFLKKKKRKKKLNKKTIIYESFIHRRWKGRKANSNGSFVRLL